ncbi:2-C-methyl-D-erythritol 4-phosphate cytidylyltransferase [Scopulibacillus darangshiensis]|uniref:2-C-methyl-D-erythritol 4-phosphate cytidylyltransferase n=1 Tax=Scopulibacillus darangshiensis TaxID=442528 RepID=A0A4R2NRW0_9BACL|nr:2-C-methyl-D-erythritol 4-phosphate cytidylyltransferase [Scopulibacillus darangshiensis]TCP24138.1 2-C-methyl-D-erythritol 4-phosphate cytidylyltransferase [Scopulibacillus darangshiensis]
MNYDVVILAAGKGKRMGAGKNKMLLEVAGIPIILHTLLAFESDKACSRIVLVINESERDIFSSFLSHFNITKVVKMVQGGTERQDSVYQGLKVLSGEGIVLIHDGARPFVKKESIARVTETARDEGAAILAVPVKDTIKKVLDHKVQETVERSDLWAVQTPQAFRLPLILAAHRTGLQRGLQATDDASLMEQTGQTVAVVEGDYQNIKITTPEDMLIAEQFMRNKKGSVQNENRARI